MRLLASLLLSCALAYAVHDDVHRKSYKGYEVLRIFSTLEKIGKLLEYGHIESYGLDVVGGKRGKFVDVLVPPEHTEETKEYLRERNMRYEGHAADLDSPLKRKKKETREERAPVYDVLDYHSFDDKLRELDRLASAFPDRIRVSRIGRSYEGRPIVQITFGLPISPVKPALLIDAGIHAREWISPAVAMWMIRELTLPQYDALLRRMDIVMLPMVNPDGYEYSRNEDRMWRKNRSRAPGGCMGVDLNRNFPFHWGEASTSRHPCSEIYTGPSALSEPESRTLSAAMKQRRFHGYLTLHSYGLNWAYPWGWQQHTYPADVEDLKAVGWAAAAAIQRVNASTRYIVANAADSVYPVGGASDDYAKSLGIKYAYTVELQPCEPCGERMQWEGFHIPPEQIDNAAREAFAGMKVVAERVADEFGGGVALKRKSSRTTGRRVGSFRATLSRGGRV